MIKKMMMFSLMAILFATVGCKMFEQNNTYIYNAGYTAALIWTNQEKPTVEVKNNIINVTEFIVSNVSETNNVTSYSNMIMPKLNEYIATNNKIKETDKPLIKITSMYMLTSIDGLLSQVNVSSINNNTGYSYVKQFSTGFADCLKATVSSSEVNYIVSTGYVPTTYVK